jgi:hypothetical protein
MTPGRLRFAALVWFVATLGVLAWAFAVSLVLPYGAFGGALAFTLFLQVSRVLAAMTFCAWIRRDPKTQTSSPRQVGSVGLSDLMYLRRTLQPGPVGRIALQTVWAPNGTAVLVAMSSDDELASARVESWLAHQCAHARKGHGWQAFLAQSGGTLLLLWVFLAFGDVDGVMAGTLSILVLILAMTTVDHVLRLAFEASLKSGAERERVGAGLVRGWADIAINPPVCRWASGVLRVTEEGQHQARVVAARDV